MPLSTMQCSGLDSDGDVGTFTAVAPHNKGTPNTSVPREITANKGQPGSTVKQDEAFDYQQKEISDSHQGRI